MKRTPRSSIPQFDPGFFVVTEGPDGPPLGSMFPLRRRTFSPVPGRRVPPPNPPRGILLLPACRFVVALRGLDGVAPHRVGLWTPPRWGLLRKGSEKETPAKGGGNDAPPPCRLSGRAVRPLPVRQRLLFSREWSRYAPGDLSVGARLRSQRDYAGSDPFRSPAERGGLPAAGGCFVRPVVLRGLVVAEKARLHPPDSVVLQHCDRGHYQHENKGAENDAHP